MMQQSNAANFDAQKEQTSVQTLVKDTVMYARKLGADMCEVGANSTSGLSVNVRFGQVETVEFNADRSLGITVYLGKKKGTASTTDVSKEMLEETVRAALNIARYTQEDVCSGLAEAEQMATSFPDLDLYHPWSLTVDEAIKRATECEQSALNVSSQLTNSDGATVSSQQGCGAYGNSHDFLGSCVSSKHIISCMPIAQKGSEMQRDYWYSVARDASFLESEQDIGRKAAQRTLERLGSRKMATGTFPVIFESSVASSLIGHFLQAISGGNLYRDASFLQGALETQIFPKWLKIYENPYLSQGFSSGAYDDDGLQTRVQSFVEEGVLRRYVLSTYSGKKLGMESTANAGGVRNLFVESNAGTLDTLIKSMGEGLLVTEFMGSSVNVVTGDYSRGVSGFWIEDGVIAYPVTEVTIAGHLKDMLTNIVQIGSDIDWRHRLYVGSIWLDHMMVAGK